MKYAFKPLEVKAIQFDGTHDCGMRIKELFPTEDIELVYDYGRIMYRLRMLVNRRFFYVDRTDYVVQGPLGEAFIYRENLFEELFDKVFQEP